MQLRHIQFTQVLLHQALPRHLRRHPKTTLCLKRKESIKEPQEPNPGKDQKTSLTSGQPVRPNAGVTTRSTSIPQKAATVQIYTNNPAGPTPTPSIDPRTQTTRKARAKPQNDLLRQSAIHPGFSRRRHRRRYKLIRAQLRIPGTSAETPETRARARVLRPNRRTHNAA